MAQERNFIQINGHKWAYLREGRGEPLVILHGFMCYADYFLPIAEELKNQFDVIIPDLPSFGFTPKLPENNIKNIIADLEKFIESFNYSKVNLFGTSFGGVLSYEYALLNPDKVKTVFAHSPVWRKESLKMNKTEDIEFALLKLPNYAIKILQSKLIFKQILNWILKYKPGARRVIRTHEELILEAASLFDIQGNREILGSLLSNDLDKRIDKLNSDSVLIACLSDEVILADEVEDLHRIIKGNLVRVRHQGHEFGLKAPDKVVKIIKEYLLYGKKSRDGDFIWDE